MDKVAPQKERPPTRIGIVEDHELMRSGMRHLLGRREDFAVVMEAANAIEAYDRIPQANLDLLTIDLALPGEDGIAVIRKIRTRWPQIKIVVFTGSSDDRLVAEAFLAGAEAFVRKLNRGQDLVEAIERVRNGSSYLCPDAASVLVEALRGRNTQAPAVRLARLSERESSILKGIAEGLSYKEIAEHLGISVKSVDTYRARLARKLACSTRAELVRHAVRIGLVSL